VCAITRSKEASACPVAAASPTTNETRGSPTKVAAAMSTNTEEGSIPTSSDGLRCCMISFVAAPFPQPTSSTRARTGKAICVI
jgi:hypothetical protein